MGRSLVLPVVIGVTAFALAAILSLLGVALWTVEASNDAAIRRATDLEIAALADSFATGGAGELAKRIGDRLALQPLEGGGSHYLLVQGDRRLAGDLPRWPALSADRSENRYLALESGRAFGRATRLGPDMKLVAARDVPDDDAVRAGLVAAFLVAGGLLVCAAAGLAFLGARCLRRRVDSMNLAFAAIEAGDSAQPIPGVDRTDELGELARHSARLTARLGALLDAQRNVTDIVAHEVRTPLARLNARATRLIEETQDPKLADAIGHLRGEVRDAGKLLDSLLDIAASERQRGNETGFVDIDLGGLIEQLRDLYAETAEERGIILTAAVQPGVTIRGDPMQLTRLLSNLVDNAFKHVGRGGRIDLMLDAEHRVSVRDDGPGVPEAMRQQIFEPFVRGEDRGMPGHGLGLALARAIARRHGLCLAYHDGHPGAVFTLEKEMAG